MEITAKGVLPTGKDAQALGKDAPTMEMTTPAIAAAALATIETTTTDSAEAMETIAVTATTLLLEEATALDKMTVTKEEAKGMGIIALATLRIALAMARGAATETILVAMGTTLAATETTDTQEGHQLMARTEREGNMSGSHIPRTGATEQAGQALASASQEGQLEEGRATETRLISRLPMKLASIRCSLRSLRFQRALNYQITTS